MEASNFRNRLAGETSAYLLQHAGNPVDWYPWGEVALALAKNLDRPILLSIGYSACHWCHVMERECFENEDIAALMNRHFVCIKVDREERPDLDHLYMKALQGMTGRGGWPMTVFLTPDARPFYAGTYFPPEDRNAMPGFPRVLLGVAKTYAENRSDVTRSAERIVEFLAESGAAGGGHAILTEELLAEAANRLSASIDPEYGGFGRAPKFPGTMGLMLLMETQAAADAEPLRDLLRLTLDRMAAGGIRDHLGGGFHRYSTDRIWLVPHFEKMLYDQALLVDLYAAGFRYFADRRYADVAAGILEYVVREMTSPDGGFSSAQDADSEGEEGKFFVWTREEILDVLGSERGAVFCEVYGVTADGNFGEGRSILHRARHGACGDEEGTARKSMSEAELAVCRAELLGRRAARVAPATDRKVMADWNGLMISAMARCAGSLGRTDLVEAALRAAAFLRTSMMDSDGLMHVHADGTAKIPAFLDDYACFGRACLDLLAVCPDRDHFETAVFCAERLLAEFQDESSGGFFFTGVRNESLVARTCDLHDSAVPAGNSVAAELLLRLWELTGEDRYRKAGERVVERFLAYAIERPHGASWLLAVAARPLRGSKTVVVVGGAGDRERLARAARESFAPGAEVFSIGPEEKDWYPSLLRGKKASPAGAVAYICEGMTCGMPITDPEELRRALSRQPRQNVQGPTSPGKAPR